MRRARRVVPLVVAQQPAEAANIVVPGKVAVEEPLERPQVISRAVPQHLFHEGLEAVEGAGDACHHLSKEG